MPMSLAAPICLALAVLASPPVAARAPEQAPLEQARAASRHGDDDAAIAILERAVTAFPNSAEVHLQLGSAYGSKAQKVGMMGAATYAPKMKTEFEAAVALDPKLVDARYGLVQYYTMLPAMMGGSSDKAFEQAKAIQAIDPVFGHRARAFIHSQQKHPDLARKEYLDGIHEQPRSAKAHGYFGQYLVNVEKDYGGAFAEFDTALALDAGYMSAWFQIGRAAAQADSNLARGEAALKRYLAHTPRENEPTLASANYFLGLIHEKQGRKADAQKSYQAALDINPTLKDAAEGLKRVR